MTPASTSIRMDKDRIPSVLLLNYDHTPPLALSSCGRHRRWPRSPPPRLSPRRRTAARRARSFMWKATRQQGVVYLVGSVHMLTKDFYPLAPALDAGFKDSDLLVEEVDLAEMLAPTTQFSLLARGMLPAGQTLDKVVSPATMALVNARVGSLGMPIAALQQFKPWFLAMTLMAVEWQKAGFDADARARQALLRSRADRKQSRPGPRDHRIPDLAIRRHDDEPAGSFPGRVAEGPRHREGQRPEARRRVEDRRSAAPSNASCCQDVKDDPFMYQRLLVERNRNWLPKIEALFARRGRAFVVVGAAHLVGPDGLLAMLQGQGRSTWSSSDAARARRGALLRSSSTAATMTGAAAADAVRWWAHVQFLADDSLEGRDTGSPGTSAPPSTSPDLWRKAGLEPAGTGEFIQPVAFKTRQIDESRSSLALVRDGTRRAADARRGRQLQPAHRPRADGRRAAGVRRPRPQHSRSAASTTSRA